MVCTRAGPSLELYGARVHVAGGPAAACGPRARGEGGVVVTRTAGSYLWRCHDPRFLALPLPMVSYPELARKKLRHGETDERPWARACLVLEMRASTFAVGVVG